MYWVAAAEIGFLEVAQVSDVGQAALPFGITMAEPGVAELTPQLTETEQTTPAFPLSGAQASQAAWMSSRTE